MERVRERGRGREKERERGRERGRKRVRVGSFFFRGRGDLSVPFASRLSLELQFGILVIRSHPLLHLRLWVKRGQGVGGGGLGGGGAMLSHLQPFEPFAVCEPIELCAAEEGELR